MESVVQNICFIYQDTFQTYIDILQIFVINVIVFSSSTRNVY